MPAKIMAAAGSILDPSLAEGIAVFIPPCKTSNDDEARNFFLQMCGRPAEGACTFAPVSARCRKKLKVLCLIDNRVRLMAGLEDMQRQLREVLNEFIRLGIRNVAMNGIRFDPRAFPLSDPVFKRVEPSVLPPLRHADSTTGDQSGEFSYLMFQRIMVEEFSAGHPDAFEKIILVDPRGEFRK